MARARAYGADATLRAIFESTYGTSPADGYFKLPFFTASLGAAQPLGYDPLLGFGRDAQDPFYEGIAVDGDLEVPIDLQGIGFWLKGLFGAPDTTDNAGVYTHVFTSGGELPSLSIETGHPNLSTARFLLDKGVRLGEISFDMARSGVAKARITAIGQSEARASSTVDASPSVFDLTRFLNARGSVLVDDVAVANITGGSFTFLNNLDAVETIRSDEVIEAADETEATATGSVTFRTAASSPLDTAALAKTPVAMKWAHTLPGAEGYKLEWFLPRVFLPAGKDPISGPGGVSSTREWRAAFDTAEGFMVTATLVNDVASY